MTVDIELVTETLQKVVKERDELGALIEYVRTSAEKSIEAEYGTISAGWLVTTLDQAPENVLEAHDIMIAHRIANKILAVFSDPDRKRPIRDDGEFPTDLMNDYEWAAHIARTA